MGTVTRTTQRLMAPAGDARGHAWSPVSPSVAVAKSCAHAVTENFGDLATRWPEEAPL